MRLTKEKIEAINDKMENISGSVLRVNDSLCGVGLQIGIMVFADLEEATRIKKDLEALIEITKDETGIIL